MSLCTIGGFALSSRGVSSIHFGFEKFSRKLPLNVLPPLLVTMLMTPPEKRPHSAEIPFVMMLVSWIASSMKRLCGLPNRLSLMSTPFSMNTLSYANAPAMFTWPTFGELLVSPGASSAICAGVRPTGSASSSRLLYTVLSVTVASAAGVMFPTTFTVSVTEASVIVWFTSVVPPTVRSTVPLVAGLKLGISNATA